MKGHFCKLFTFLASMNSDNNVKYTRPRSGLQLQLPVQRMPFTKKRIHVYVTVSGEGGLNKQTHFANNTMPRRQQSQPVIRDRKVTESEVLSGHRCNFDPVFRNSSATFDRTKEVNVNLNKSVVMEDFESEIWSSLQKVSTFSETRVQHGYLTTTLCSTEL